MRRHFSIVLFFCLPFICCSQVSSDFYKIDNNFTLFKKEVDTLSDKLSFTPKFAYTTYMKQENILNDIFYLGFKLNYSISDKFKVNSEIITLKGRFPVELYNYVDSLYIFPGYAEILNTGYDYTFRLNYNISKYFNFDIGRGKHFIGSGYRSLLISNESTAYPYALLTTNIWKFRYYNLYASLSDIQDPNRIKKKYSTTHYFEYSPTDYLSFGLFESVIWQAQDSIYNRGYDIEYLNPIIFYRPVEFSKKSPDNVLIGATIQLKYKSNYLYGQLILDDLNIALKKNNTTGDPSSGGFFQDKYAYQVGLKSEKLLNNQNLAVLIEFNQVQPFTYGHKSPEQNYTHYNQALAHPIGANFREFIFISKYIYHNWKLLFKYTNAFYGTDTLNTHYGQNIFLSDYLAEGGIHSYGNFNGQGIKTHLQNIYIDIGYNFKDLHNLEIHMGCALRKKKSHILNQENLYFFAGLRTFFYNPFQDF